MAANPRFKQLLDEGVTSVARRRDMRLAKVEKEIAYGLGFSVSNVQRWRRGFVPLDLEQVAFLVRYCVTKGRLDREWASSMLTQARYPIPEPLLLELFPDGPACTDVAHVYHNLQSPTGDFVGRQLEMKLVHEALGSGRRVTLIAGGPGQARPRWRVRWAGVPGQRQHDGHSPFRCRRVGFGR